MSITIYTPTGQETFTNPEIAENRINELLDNRQSVQVHYNPTNKVKLPEPTEPPSCFGCSGGNLEY